MLNNKKGSTLAMLIVIIAILSVLSLTVLKISLTDNLQYVQQDKKMQSYYLAKAGADIVAEHLIDNLDIILGDDDFVKSGEESVIEASGGLDNSVGDYSVLVNRVFDGDDVSDVVIKSTGTLENQVTRIQLTLSPIIMDNAIFAHLGYDLDGLEVINGHVGSNGIVTGTPHDGLIGERRNNMDITIPSAEFDLLPTEDGDNFEASTDTIYNLVDDSDAMDSVLYNTVENEVGFDIYDYDPDPNPANLDFFVYDLFDFSAPSNLLTFDTRSNVLRIVCNDLIIKGDMQIENYKDQILYDADPTLPKPLDGKVIIYVHNSGIIHNPGDVSNHPDDFVVYLAPDATLEIKNPKEFSGRIIGPEAEVTIVANSQIRGSIIAGTFYGESGTTVEYVTPRDGDMLLGFHRRLWE